MPGLIPFDLTRGGSLFRFRDNGKINEYAVYVQDSYSLGHLTLNGGVRFDAYDGLSQANGVEPRIGVSYSHQADRHGAACLLFTHHGDAIQREPPAFERFGRGRVASNIFGAFESVPLRPGTRNQYNAGFEQSLGRYLTVDADYFWKFTDTAYDFDTLFNTPIAFPISWRRSKLDGVSGSASPITSCTSSCGATRTTIPAPGTFNADTNPPRIAPRHILDASVGTDNLLHTEPVHVTLRISVPNLTNDVALYNFLSTFSGTHFLEPRSYQISMGVEF